MVFSTEDAMTETEILKRKLEIAIKALVRISAGDSYSKEGLMVFAETALTRITKLNGE